MNANFAKILVVCLTVGIFACQPKTEILPKSPYEHWKWNELPPLAEVRELPRLVELNGNILVIGGGSELRETAMISTETFNIAKRTWSTGPQLVYPTRDAEVVKLEDGRILAIGGSTGKIRTGSTSVQILEPNGSKWELAAPMKYARIGHTALLLKDGRVLVIGGQVKPGEYLQSAEIYDSKDNTWTETGLMNEVRSLHHARPLPDGRVIAIGGGTDETASTTAEIYDPNTNTWKYTGSMREPRWGFASAVMDDGRILIAGGRVPAIKGATLPDDQMVILPGAEIYDPKTEQWTPTTPMNVPRSMGLPNVSLVKLASGGFLFMGGRSYPRPYHGVTSAEYFDPQTSKWTMVGDMPVGASYMASILLSTGEVLVVGGRGREFLPLKSVQIFEQEKQR